jgi:hypothetical protein
VPPLGMPSHVGRWIIDKQACSSRLPLRAPARCGAVADERRVVAGDGRVRTRNAHLSGSALRAIPCPQAAPPCPPPACGRSSRAGASLGASVAAGVREAERERIAPFSLRALIATSVARPRAAARSSMSGVALAGDEGRWYTPVAMP